MMMSCRFAENSFGLVSISSLLLCCLSKKFLKSSARKQFRGGGNLIIQTP